MSYVTLQFMIPKLLYKTHVDHQAIQITDLHVKAMQYNDRVCDNRIFECSGLRLTYIEDKKLHGKKIEI